jgi:hypothetical protein
MFLIAREEIPMFNPLSKLLAALGALAQSITSLSTTVDEVNNTLRARLDLDAPVEVPALPHQVGQDGLGAAPEANGLADRPRRVRRGTGAV